MAVSISKAWDETSAILRADGKLVASVVAALIMLPVALDTLISPPAAEMAGEAPAIGGPIGFVVLMIGLVGQVALTAIGLNRGATVGEAIRIGASRFLRVLGAGLLFFVPLVILLSALLVGSSGVEGVSTLPARIATGDITGQESLAVLVWLIVLIVLGVRFSLSTSVAVAEGGGPVALLRRSWALTKGHFWRILGFVLLLGLGLLVVSTAATALIGFLVTATLGAAEPMSVAALLLGLAGGIFQGLFVAIYMLMLARIYVQAASVDASVPTVERA